MRVQHNIAAMNSYRNYNNNTKSINKNLEKLSSGYKINRAGDDAAGLAISEKMRAPITGLEMAQKNAKDGISLVQTAEGALTEVHSMLNRMFSLAEQSANGTYSNEVDREQLQKEVSQLRTEIDRIADSSNFNGKKLLDGSLGGPTITKTNGAASTSATTALDFSNMSGSQVIGSTFKVNFGANVGTVTFKFVETGKGSGTNGTEGEVAASDIYEVAVGRDADGSAIATALTTRANAKIVSGEATASSGTVTLKSIQLNSSNQPELATGAATVSPDVTYENVGGLQLQIGDTSDSYNIMGVSIGDVHVATLGSDTLKLEDIDISKQGGAQSAMDAIKEAINTVSDIRGGLGAIQNRLEHTINNLSVMQENIQDAESTIRDTDVADEMMKYTKNSILVQSAQAMLAQANQQPQGVLQLLQ